MPGSPRELELVPVTRQRFSLLHTSGTVEFSQGDKGKPRIRLQLAEMDRQGDKR
jgi:hypothetical protein